VQRGDNIKKLYFINEGVVDVQVPFLDRDLHFDYLNPGSNFCVFTCYSDESLSVVNFVAKT
jgi:CRP-like cAMP-binding protein